MTKFNSAKFNSEQEQKMYDLARIEVIRNVEKISPEIDKLTSGSLKKLLKTVTHTHLGEILQGKTPEPLNEIEQNLVDNIFALQEAILGYNQLKTELEQKGVKNEQ